ncbi:hypothetical protein [Wolbachia endosymbiont of Folsomia candida]|uniref:hypothetical protein n=1 Tax=Wolbachia endosymbiont of Folsomia candida TaxID=169402 RepID=UPI000A3DE1D8|nr:hypothetical protein [Wolbachia endosymbiont of Folsomia candida]APR98298.1 hypothetical protein ASM33_03270 [Wolbachia endosymbiont of Folsomia candida]
MTEVNNTSPIATKVEVNGNNASPVVTLEATAKELDFGKLRADPGNKSAHSGKQMYLDLGRMNFIINGKEIDNNFIIALKQGAKHRESKLFNSGAIHATEVRYNDIFNEKETREIDTDFGQAFVASVLKDLEEEFAKDALAELWKDHCKNPKTTAEQKTGSYKEEFERFYNIGQKHIDLLPTEKDKNKDYRSLAKEVFKEIFKYAGAEVPSDAILKELITNCNQAGYEFVYAPLMVKLFSEHELLMDVNDNSVSRDVYINCRNSNSVKVECKIPKMPINYTGENSKTICDASFSLDFTLESQNGKDGVTYKDGELSLTVPRELKDYKVGDKSVFDIIKECFQKCCEKLGFNFKTKIKHNLGDSLKVNEHFESMQLPTQVGAHIRVQ